MTCKKCNHEMEPIVNEDMQAMFNIFKKRIVIYKNNIRYFCINCIENNFSARSENIENESSLTKYLSTLRGKDNAAINN